jgi:3-hydroxyacyl-CoA dehydrogenase/enoyl-CoA hydratase/3-hydroxybutyryl-CoA epimerase
MIFAMINEAALILEEKIVASAGELDLAMIMGTGFPPFRGGLLRYADALGVPYILARLDELSSKAGPRFTASAPLRKLAERDGKFYATYTR